MRVAIDKNGDGVIDNIAIVEGLEKAAELFPADTVLDAVSAGVRIGWSKGGDGEYSAPPEREAAPKHLTRVEFARLCMGSGGMMPEMLVAAKAAPELAAMWIMLDLAVQVQKGDPEIPPGLAALEALGHLPNGAQAVLDAWPTE
jgi:hypothetical protein